jgi:hypothetical protein
MKNRLKTPLNIFGLVILFNQFNPILASANQYYGSLSLGDTMMNDNTYDLNENMYPYTFSPNVMAVKAGVGKHVNNKFDLGFEVMNTSKMFHKYSGPVESEDNYNLASNPYTPGVSASQNIKSTTLLLQGKYKHEPLLFSNNASIYGRSGIGFAFNTSSDYLRKIKNTLQVVYPGKTNVNLGFLIGLGVEKKISQATFSIGYDMYSIGSFETQNQAFITNLNTGVKTVYNGRSDEMVGKRLRPTNLLHSVSMGVSFDF